VKRQIELSANVNTSVVDIMADVDFTLRAEGDQTEADFAEVVNRVALAPCVGKATLPLGHYNVRLFAVITRDEHDETLGPYRESGGQLPDQEVSGTSEAD